MTKDTNFEEKRPNETEWQKFCSHKWHWYEIKDSLVVGFDSQRISALILNWVNGGLYPIGYKI